MIGILIITIFALIISIILVTFNKQENKAEEYLKRLPGYNCGACGKAGCAAFAEALVTGEAPAVSGCKVIKPDNKQAIKDYLDVTPGPDGSTINVKL